jgi:hypothetical protein
VLVPPLQCAPQQQARQARYVLQELLPLLTEMLQQQEAEVGAANMLTAGQTHGWTSTTNLQSF